MNWLRWRPGRQDSGYFKMLLACGRWPIPFDVYLLRYPTGSYLEWYADPLDFDGKSHFRCNILLKQASCGGDFRIAGQPIINLSRLQVFRPDILLHSVTKIKSGTRWVLSIGWLR